MTSTFTNFFGGGGAKGGNVITDPRHFSAGYVGYGELGVKTAVTGTALSNTDLFFTSGALFGAQASISAADTYATLCDINGSGFLCNVVSPAHSAGAIQSFRLTVDGVEYVISPGAPMTNIRAVLGPTVPGVVTTYSATAVAGHLIGLGSYADAGFSAAKVGNFDPLFSAYLLRPVIILAHGLQCLRFETSLKVEVKSSLLDANTTLRRALATYRLDL